jgi:hypothetical protein
MNIYYPHFPSAFCDLKHQLITPQTCSPAIVEIVTYGSKGVTKSEYLTFTANIYGLECDPGEEVLVSGPSDPRRRHTCLVIPEAREGVPRLWIVLERLDAALKMFSPQLLRKEQTPLTWVPEQPCRGVFELTGAQPR